MNDIPHIIEAALLLVIAFLIGCILGWFLRTKIFRKRTKTNIVESGPTAENSGAKNLGKRPDSMEKSAKVAVVSEAGRDTTSLEQIGQDTDLKMSGQAQEKPSSPTLNVVASKPRKAEIAKSAEFSKSAAIKPAPVAETSSSVGHESGKPEAMNAPRPEGKDDLKKIKGIGPKLEDTLNGLGIYHFDQIAKWKRAEIDWVDNYLSFKGRIDRDDWISQSKKLSS